MDAFGAVEVLRTYILMAFQVVLPLMIVTLTIAIVFGVLQAVMQVQEQTLTFFPKLVALVLVLVFLGPWMYEKMIENVLQFYQSIAMLQ